MEIVELSIEDFDQRAKNHPHSSFYQSSDYGKLMETTGFRAHYIGLFDDDNDLIGLSLVLTKKLYSQFRYGYAPRGFLVDYKDPVALKLWTLHMKKYFRRKNVVFIKVDPPIIHMERNVDGTPKNGAINNREVIRNLLKLDYIHMGFNRNFKTLKPRWKMVIKENDVQKLYSRLDDDLKYKLYASENKGIEIFEGNSSHMKDFYSFVKDKHTRKLNYYQNYYNILNGKKRFGIYFVRVNPMKYLETVREALSDEYEKNEKHNEEIRNNPTNNEVHITAKMDSDKLITQLKKEIVIATEMLKSQPEGILIAASAVIRYKTQLIFLIDGINPKYKMLAPNHYLKWKIIEAHMNVGYDHIDLNGISGDFNPKSKYNGLYEFKKSFGSEVVEYIGEFNLVINKAKYFLSRKVFGMRNNLNKEKQEKNTF